MKWIKALVLIAVLPTIVCVLTGNPFDFMLAYKNAVKTLKEEYDNKLVITDYRYDSENGGQIFTVCDENGTTDEYIYSPQTNSFQNGYRESYLSVSHNEARGKLLRLIINEKCFPEDIDIVTKSESGIIGDGNEAEIKSLKVFIGKKDKSDFAEDVKKIAKAIKNCSIKKVEIYSPDCMFSITDNAVSTRTADIVARIKENK